MADEAMTPRKQVPLGAFLAYNTLVVPLLVSALHLSRFTNEKARAGLDGRRGLWRRLEHERERLRGCVWFHASSVGEYEQARPIIRAFRAAAAERGETVPTLLTVFSPSGYGYARDHMETDLLEYLPLDTAPAARRMMRLLEPRALVFVKFDCWPNHVWAARREGVPLLLLDATFHRKSQRLRLGARGFFRDVFDAFDVIGAAGAPDARRFQRDLGVRTRLEITGDTRVDQVVHRYEGSADHPLAKLLAAQPHRYLALGSVWPADLAVILAPTLDALERDEGLGLIAVPHEPTPEHLAEIESALEARGLRPTRLSELVELRSFARRSTAAAKDPSRWRTIVVDTVGVLAEIYRATVLSYVGGSFTTGVHSVLEPAVTGQPVLFGPRIHNAYEAERLVEEGGGFVVETRDAARRTLEGLLGDPERLAAAGRAAGAYVAAQSGATEASLALLAPYALGAFSA